MFVSQHANTFSSQGDVLLVDLSYYQTITKTGGLQTAMATVPASTRLSVQVQLAGPPRRSIQSLAEMTATPSRFGKCRALPVMTAQSAASALAMNGQSPGSGSFSAVR